MQPDLATSISNHRRACDGFAAVVAQGAGRWANPSPCADWDARAVVEHVIGIHEELLLRPAGTEHVRSSDDPIARWSATVLANESAVVAASSSDLERALPALMGEVVVHTWDVAKAIGVDAALDPELCEIAYEFLRANETQVRSSGLFDAAAPVATDADVATQLIAFVGRDPAWRA